MKKVATSVYLLKDKKILFLVRNKKNDTVHKQGMYLPIGGKVEPAESIEECAIREVKEESGIIVKSLELKGVDYIKSQNSWKDDWVNFVFISKDFKGKAKAGNEGHFEWVDIDKIKNSNLYEGDKIYLQYMFKYKFFVVEFLYKDYKLIETKLIRAI